MALSDQLSKLAAKAKEAEDRAAAAQGKAKADLEKDVKTARDSAQARADQLRKNAETDKGTVSDWWTDVQRSWSEHVETVRQHVDEKPRRTRSRRRAAGRVQRRRGCCVRHRLHVTEQSRRPNTRSSTPSWRGRMPTTSRAAQASTS